MWDTTSEETILTFRNPKIPFIWQGYFGDDYFLLYPTNDELLLIIKQFVLDYMKWTPKEVLSEKYHEYTGRVFQIGKDKPIFHLVGKDGEGLLSSEIYGEEGNNIRILVKDIGLAFNEVLKTGKYHEHIIAIPENEEY